MNESLLTVAPCLIREATPNDLPHVVAVLRAAHAEFAEVMPAPIYRDYLANILDVRGRLADSQLFVAELDGNIVSTISLYPDASREGWGWPATWAGIRALGVAPAARGLGIGRHLIAACIDRSRAQGAGTVCVHTAAFMAAAVAMYERAGFERIPEFDLDLGAMFRTEPLDPPISVLAYKRDLSAGPLT
jgi:ribosomal protein S18 acetylase RimI-like enzyme